MSKKRNQKISLPKLLPNIFTTVGLCSGLTGIRFALDGNWQNAVFCILVAACFDMIDGLSARLLKAFSPFGAELDKNGIEELKKDITEPIANRIEKV